MISNLLPPGVSDVPVRILLALLAIAVLFLARTVLARLLAMVFYRLTKQSTDHSLYTSAATPVRLLLLALGIDVCARILFVGGDVTIFAGRLTRTLVILAVFVGLFEIISLVTRSRSRMYSATRIVVEDQLLPFVRTGLQLIMIALLLIIVIQICGYDVSGLIAGLGLGGLAFSLAAQDTIANLFGFSMIVGDRPFVVGEYIVTPDVEGTVERVGLRSTRVRQNNQAIVTVPNSKIAGSTVLNWSRLSKRWIDFRLPVYYRASAEQIEDLMRRIRAMLATRELLDKNSIQVQLVEFSTNGLVVMVRAYVNLSDWLKFIQEQEQIYLNILRIMQKLELDVAFPGQSVYIRQTPDLAEEIHDIMNTNRQSADALPADTDGAQPQ